jgi:hypothetical protein
MNTNNSVTPQSIRRQFQSEGIFRIKSTKAYVASKDEEISFNCGQSFYALTYHEEKDQFFVSTHFSTPFARNAVNGFVPASIFVTEPMNPSQSRTSKNKALPPYPSELKSNNTNKNTFAGRGLVDTGFVSLGRHFAATGPQQYHQRNNSNPNWFSSVSRKTSSKGSPQKLTHGTLTLGRVANNNSTRQLDSSSSPQNNEQALIQASITHFLEEDNQSQNMKFVIRCRWRQCSSNGIQIVSQTTVTRTYEDFASLHKTLLHQQRQNSKSKISPLFLSTREIAHALPHLPLPLSNITSLKSKGQLRPKLFDLMCALNEYLENLFRINLGSSIAHFLSGLVFKPLPLLPQQQQQQRHKQQQQQEQVQQQEQQQQKQQQFSTMESTSPINLDTLGSLEAPLRKQSIKTEKPIIPRRKQSLSGKRSLFPRSGSDDTLINIHFSEESENTPPFETAKLSQQKGDVIETIRLDAKKHDSSVSFQDSFFIAFLGNHEISNDDFLNPPRRTPPPPPFS